MTHLNVYFYGEPGRSRMLPHGLGEISSVAPLLLSGEYDSTMRCLSTVDGTLETSGEVECPVGWFALVDLSDFTDRASRQQHSEWLAGCEEGLQVKLPAGGWYIYQQDNQGTSWVYECEDEDHAKLIFQAMEQRYSDWLGDDDESEPRYNCPVCGHTWDEETPAGRCPNEADHPEPITLTDRERRYVEAADRFRAAVDNLDLVKARTILSRELDMIAPHLDETSAQRIRQWRYENS